VFEVQPADVTVTEFEETVAIVPAKLPVTSGAAVKTGAIKVGVGPLTVPAAIVVDTKPTTGVLTALDWAKAWVEKAAPAARAAKEIFKLFIFRFICFFTPLN